MKTTYHRPPGQPISRFQGVAPGHFRDWSLINGGGGGGYKTVFCRLLLSIGQGIELYKVLVVGKNGKLNETIEVSALWSNRTVWICIKPWPMPTRTIYFWPILPLIHRQYRDE